MLRVQAIRSALSSGYTDVGCLWTFIRMWSAPPCTSLAQMAAWNLCSGSIRTVCHSSVTTVVNLYR